MTRFFSDSLQVVAVTSHCTGQRVGSPDATLTTNTQAQRIALTATRIARTFLERLDLRVREARPVPLQLPLQAHAHLLVVSVAVLTSGAGAAARAALWLRRRDTRVRYKEDEGLRDHVPQQSEVFVFRTKTVGVTARNMKRYE